MSSEKYEGTFRLLLGTTRPAQWVKNLFVAAPVVFAKEHTAREPSLMLFALFATILFVFLSASVYIFNDWRDAPRDRLHPEKRRRPLASGRLNARTALTASGLLAATGLSGALTLGAYFFITALLYLALSTAYTLWLKQVAYLDVLLIATGFLLRILAGCFAIGLSVSEISYFLVTCTFLVALFLALSKRRAEMDHTNNTQTREALEFYKREHLDTLMLLVAIVTVLTYCFYTISPRTIAYFGTYRLAWTIPFVILGFVRFFRLANRVQAGRSPTDVMIRDPWFNVIIVSWLAVAIWAIYW